jgi:hypothetical protein
MYMAVWRTIQTQDFGENKDEDLNGYQYAGLIGAVTDQHTIPTNSLGC